MITRAARIGTIIAMTPIRNTRRLLLVTDRRVHGAAPATSGVRRYRLASLRGEQRQPVVLGARKPA